MYTILSLLADGQSHQLTQLAEQAGLSLEQTLQKIAALSTEGLIIEQDSYQCRLIAQGERLDLARLSVALPNNPVITHTIIDSTNQYLLKNAATLTSGTICLSEYQTAGRGRRGRKWHSPFAGQVILSLLQRFDKALDLAGLSLIVGLAVVEVLQKLGYQQVQLKWPNDILLANKKLGGILIEMTSTRHSDKHTVIIGLGLNVQLAKMENLIEQPVAMLAEQGLSIDRNSLIIALVDSLNEYLHKFSEQGLTPFISEWNKVDAFYQQPVKILLERETVLGVVQGITEQGELIVQTEKGIRHFHSGEISLRQL